LHRDLAATAAPIARAPGAAAAAVGAINKARAALNADLTLATKLGRKLLPPAAADLVAGLVRRDLRPVIRIGPRVANPSCSGGTCRTGIDGRPWRSRGSRQGSACTIDKCR
jgi:hypothetical protein